MRTEKRGQGKAGTGTNLLQIAEIQASPALLKTARVALEGACGCGRKTGDRHESPTNRGDSRQSCSVENSARRASRRLRMRTENRGQARISYKSRRFKPVPVFPASVAPGFQQSKPVAVFPEPVAVFPGSGDVKFSTEQASRRFSWQWRRQVFNRASQSPFFLAVATSSFQQSKPVTVFPRQSSK